MAVRLRVPDQYSSSLAEFLRLSPRELAAFLEALREGQPNLALDEFVDSIANRLPLERSSIDSIITLLLSLHKAREGFGLSVPELVAELRAAMEVSGKEELRPPDWTEFETAISQALAGENAFSISAKAVGLMVDHERIYDSGRILTDLRPVFKAEIEEEPDAFLIAHTLKIAYYEGGEHHHFFVALDSKDLAQLADLLTRALKKEDSLLALVSSKGIKTLEVKR